ncbi:MAG TPA: class I SAM-dependent methyltransferase [Gaiellaceae bacterium]|nr:class I SAM-dependent methyltransferase [Gaiellaceae bacterium]
MAEETMEQGLRRKERAVNYNAWLYERNRPHLGAKVLDLGAGIGTFSRRLAEDAELVVACEPDAELLPQLRDAVAGLANVRVIATDVARLDPGELGTRFDAIVCSNVLEHVPDHEQALRRAYELLEPGGRLLLLVPAHEALFGPIDRALGHERRYGKTELHRLLAGAGFRVATLRYVNPIGAVGWLVAGRVLRRGSVPAGQQELYDRLVPLLRVLDTVELPFGLSLWAVAVRPAASA